MKTISILLLVCLTSVKADDTYSRNLSKSLNLNNSVLINHQDNDFQNNETDINITQIISKSVEKYISNKKFDPHYLDYYNETEIIPNITREKTNRHRIYTELSKWVYIIELCDFANETDNQNLLTYIKLNDQILNYLNGIPMFMMI